MKLRPFTRGNQKTNKSHWLSPSLQRTHRESVSLSSPSHKSPIKTTTIHETKQGPNRPKKQNKNKNKNKTKASWWWSVAAEDAPKAPGIWISWSDMKPELLFAKPKTPGAACCYCCCSTILQLPPWFLLLLFPYPSFFLFSFSFSFFFFFFFFVSPVPPVLFCVLLLLLLSCRSSLSLLPNTPSSSPFVCWLYIAKMLYYYKLKVL